MTQTTYYTLIPSPLGNILLVGTESELTFLNFQNGTHPETIQADWIENKAIFSEAIHQIDAYFAGKLTHFTLPLSPSGTEFQQTVWKALETIPYGQTVSYGDLAQQIGKPKAVRAVGAANGRNPIPLIIPCHRVIGSDGKLTGYGGGLPIKKALLSLEINGRLDIEQQLSLF